MDTELHPEQRQYLSLITSSGEALLALINDVLDFSKIEAGRLELEALEFSPVDCIADALKTLAMRAHTKGLELIYNVADTVPPRLIGDPGRLRQIVLNLAGNAIKFTEQGEIEVTVALASHSRCVGDTAPVRTRHRDRHSRGQAAHHFRGIHAS